VREPIFLTPVFKERIWGGSKLRTEFGYDIESDLTGECWAVSAHPNGQSTVSNGLYKGKTLGQLWDVNKEVFGNLEGEVFPLLTKILDANKNLSIQVHPDDTYANKYENGELGKTECWYVIDCEENAEIIFGHTAQTKEELKEMIEQGQWEHLLKKVKVKPGDFFYVPSGTIHALCTGVLILETQQSSDTTYRVYDYDRMDQNGEKRELHINKSLDVTTVPHRSIEVNPIPKDIIGGRIIPFIKEEYFSVYKWEIETAATINQDQSFLICSVIKGAGEIRKDDILYPLNKGDHFILPNEFGYFEILGDLELIVSHP